MNTFLPIITTIIALLKSLEYIYLYQIKEYRFDRFDNYLREEGILRVLYATPPKLPAATIRNTLIAALDVVMAIALYFLFSYYPPQVLIGLIALSPFIGFLLTSISVCITSIFAHLRRAQIVEAARRKIAQSDTVFIGITGSYGKTTTKEFLYEILKAKFKVGKTEENMNTEVGVAMSILKNLHKDTQYFIAEAGAYRQGEIRRVCALIHPQIAILTAIGNQHMALFGSRRNLVAAKSELLDALPQEGIAYINREIPEFKEIVGRLSHQARSFALNGQADIKATDTKETATTTEATITYGKHSLHLKTHLGGRHNVQNLLPAIGVAFDLGMKPEEIAKAVTALAPVAAKLTKKHGLGGATFIMDTYSSNVEGFLAAIHAAHTAKGFDTKILVTRGILELGGEKKSSYARLLKALEDTKITLMTTDRMFKQLEPDVQQYGSEQQLLNALMPLLTKDTLVVVEGKFSPHFLADITRTSQG
jgi:UDP-N-acetylmuramoyl-tripeptide--D-alanyl-D-alanine ligase